MGVEVPAIGSPAWGQPLNTALSTMANGLWNPEDMGFTQWSYDPGMINQLTGVNPASGTVRMVRLPRLPEGVTLNAVSFFIGSAAITPTAGQCFAGVYNSSGLRLGQSADISGQLGVVGMINFALSAPLAVGAGDYFAALLMNASGVPSLGVSNGGALNAAVVNGGLPASIGRVTDGPTAQTSLPLNITMSSRTLITHNTWAGVRP